MSDCMKHAWYGWRNQHRNETEAGVALLNQLLDTIGWGNATAMQLHRLREAVKLMRQAHYYTATEVNDAKSRVDLILSEPLPKCPGNVVQGTIKDLQSQVRELEIANEGRRQQVMELKIENERLQGVVCHLRLLMSRPDPLG